MEKEKIREKVRKKVKKEIYSVWQEGKNFDAWLIAHFFAGIVLGFGLLLLNADSFYSHIIVLVVLIVWEFLEIFFGIKENKKNQIIDLIVGYLGFVISFLVYPIYFSHISEMFYLSFSVLFAVSSVGWVKYMKYQI